MVDFANLTSTPTIPAYPQATPTETNRLGEPAPATGAGSAAPTGPVPPASFSGVADAVMGSLRRMMPDISNEALQVMLLEVFTKIKETMGKNENETIEADQAAQRNALRDKQAKITQSEQKMEEATEKREKLSVWDKVKVAFQYVGAITAIISGVIAMAAGGPIGIAAGLMLITAGVLLFCMAADATYVAANSSNGNTSLGLVGEMHKAVLMNNDPSMTEAQATEKAQKADATARIVFTVVAAALMIGAAIVNIAGAVQGVASVVSLATRAATVANNALSAGATVATGTGDIAAAVGKRDASNMEAEAKTLEGESKEFQALVGFLEDMIDLVMTRMKGLHETFEANLDALVSAVRDLGETMGRVGSRV